MEGFLITPIPYSPRFKMQLIFSAGLRYEWPGAVLATNMWSRLRHFYQAIIAILTLRNVARCSGPPSVYIIRAGGICSMEPYFAINTSATSRVLLKAEEGLMAVIFNKTFGSPRYHESSMLSLIWLIKIMVKLMINSRTHDQQPERLHFFQKAPKTHKVKWQLKNQVLQPIFYAHRWCKYNWPNHKYSQHIPWHIYRLSQHSEHHHLLSLPYIVESCI